MMKKRLLYVAWMLVLLASAHVAVSSSSVANSTNVVKLGDVNADGVVNVADITQLVNYLTSTPAHPINAVAADANRDGDINSDDEAAIANIILSGTPDKSTNSILFFTEAAVDKIMGDDAFTVPVVFAGSTGAITYSASPEGVVTINATTGEVTIIGAGQTTITATLAADDNHSGATAQYMLTVDKSTPADLAETMITEPEATTDNEGDAPTYTGEPIPLITSGESSAGMLKYLVTTTDERPSKDDDGWSTEAPSAQNAGTYYVWYYAVGNDIYYPSDISATPITVIITKAAPTVTAPAFSALTYTGEAQNLVSAGTSEHGTFTYATTQEGEYSTTIPLGTDAGSYTVWYKFTGDGNHSDIAATEVTDVSIAKATATVTAPTANELTYTGEAQALVTAGSTTGGTLKYSLSENGEYSTEIPTGTDAGNYTVYYKVEGSNDYNDVAAASVAVNIAKAAPTVTAPAFSALTYTGEAQNLVSAGTSEHGTFTYATTENGEYSTTIPQGTDAGSYTVWYKFTGDANHSDIAATEVTGISIGKATATVTAPTANELTYTGEAQALVTAGSTTGGTLKYSLSENGEYSTEIPTGTDAGNYTVYYKVVGGDNYNDVAAASVAVNIAKADPTVTAPAFSALTYTGEAQNLVSAGTSEHGTFTYSTAKEGEYTDAIPQGTDAGNYTVWYKFTGDGNHSDIAATEVTDVSIAKATATVTAPTANELTYTGSAQALVTAGSTTGGTLKYCLSENGDYITEIPTGTNAGDYTVYYKVDGGDNYNDVAVASVAVNIAKAAPTVTAPAFSALTYTGEAQNLVSAGTSEHGTFTYATAENGTYTEAIPQGTDAGSYTVWYKFTGDGNHSDIASTEVTGISIGKATATVTAPTANELTYTGSAQALVTAGSTTGGTLKYCLTADGEYSDAIPTGTDAGDYTVYYKVEGGDNYNDVATANIPVSIAAATLSVTASEYSSTYDGAAHGITVTCEGATIMYSETEGSYTLNTSPTLTDVGSKTVYYQVSKDNYTTVTGSETITITQASNSFTTQPTITGWTYGQSANDPTGGVASFGTITYKYCATENGEYGTYDAIVNGQAGTWYVKGFVDETTNYAAAESNAVEFTISAATLSVTASEYSGTYDGAAHGITVVCEGATIKYGESDGIYTLDASPTLTDVGSKTVYYQVSKVNYTTVTGSKTITITQATNSFTTQPTITGWTYGQSANDPTGGVASFGTITYKYCATENGEYGTYDAIVNGQAGTWYVKGFVDETTNYAAAESNAVEFTISAATLSVTANEYSGTYDGAAHGITVVCEGATIKYGESDGIYTLDASPTLTDVGSKTVYYQVSKVNYTTVTGSKTITITQATNSFTTQPTITGWTYGESANDPTGGVASFGTSTITYNYCATENGEYGTYDAIVNGQAGTWYVKGFVEATTNYAAATSEAVSFTISRANPIASYPTAVGDALTYNGTAQTLFTAGSVGGTIKFKVTTTNEEPANTDGFTTTIPQQTNAGHYYLWFYVEGNDNYIDISISLAAQKEIHKAPSEVTDDPRAENGNFTYDGNERLLFNTGTAQGGSLMYKVTTTNDEPANTDGFTDYIPVQTNAGTYYLWFYVEGDNNHDDSGILGPIEKKIEKAAGRVELSEENVEFDPDDNEKSLSVNVNTSGGELRVMSNNENAVRATIDSNGNVTLTRQTNDFDAATIIVTSAATDNYEEAIATCEVWLNRVGGLE